MDSSTIGQIYRDDDFQVILSEAECCVKNDWEMEFIEGLAEKYKQFGCNMFFSEKQKVILDRILER